MASQKGMAKTSTRTLWKGAITFGLVLIPIAPYSATAETNLNFDWLDKRSMDPVGYKRINKKTGKEIAAAYPRTTQTIEIESFVDADDVPFVCLARKTPARAASKRSAPAKSTTRRVA